MRERVCKTIRHSSESLSQYVLLADPRYFVTIETVNDLDIEPVLYSFYFYNGKIGGRNGKENTVITKEAPSETGYDPEGAGGETADIIPDHK